MRTSSILVMGMLALLKTSSFDTWSCHLLPRMERKQCWWNRSSSLICFRSRTRVSAPYRRVGMTTMALYTWIYVERGSEWLGHTFFNSLPKELPALDKRLSRSLLNVASLEMTLPWLVKYSTALRIVPSMLMWGLYDSRGGGLYNTSVFLGWWWGRSSWLHQRSGGQCAVRHPPWGREGRSRQQTVAQWWVPRWFSCRRGDAEGWRDCRPFGNGCRCRLAGSLLPYGAWCWRRRTTMWEPERIPAWRRWRWGSCPAEAHCASPDLADLHGAGRGWWEMLRDSQGTS